MPLPAERIGMNLSRRFGLQGKVAVAIGAGGALAGAVSRGWAEVGAKIAVCDIIEPKGLARAQEIRDLGGEAEFFYLNATEKNSIISARSAIVNQLGEPDILLCAAGGNLPKEVTVGPDNPVENIALADWMTNYHLNTISTLLPCQVFGAGMIQRGQGGNIINIASVTAHLPLSKVIAYSAAKAGVLSITKFLAREWAKFDIQVNSITPGFFPADQNYALLFQDYAVPVPRTSELDAFITANSRRFKYVDGEPSCLAISGQMTELERDALLGCFSQPNDLDSIRFLFEQSQISMPTDRTKAVWTHTPMKRFGKPEELIAAAILLASHNATTFTTGMDLVVDGGYMCQTIPGDGDYQ